MKKHTIILLMVLNCFITFSCSKNSADSIEVVSSNVPTNLKVITTIVGISTEKPNGDGSGNVNFTINANNATSYKIDFGNGEVKTIKEGSFNYNYSISGTKTYTVRVSAMNLNKEISTSIPITIFVDSKIIWSDEFDVDGAPSSTNWGYDTGAGGWGNNEPQYYTNRSENVIVEGGLLKIITKKENYLGSTYTSARLLSKGKYSFKYGKVEFRAKMPSYAGTWPALWLLGDNIGTASWPACGEIDVMEHLGNQLNKIYATLHYPGHSGESGDSSNTIISNASTEFHLYSIDWRADSIKFYVDNKLFKTFANLASMPFNQDFFIIINCAIGGDFGGKIDPNFVSSIFEIDYVRVYN